MSTLRFLTNYAGVLAWIAKEPGIRVRDIAIGVGITERAAHKIVGELETEGYLTRHRVGARNFYEVHPDRPLCPSTDSALSVGELLRVLVHDAHRDSERST